jgi:O-methyltransferase domain
MKSATGSAAMDELQPAERVWELINMHTLARCMHVIAEFGVADALENKASSAAELAAATGLNANALGRMLRLVAAHGVFASMPEGYLHTPASRLLRSDHPQSLRSFARMIGMPVIWHGFTDLAHAARTGKPATDMAGLFAYFSEHPAEASLFNQAMAGKSAGVLPTVLEAYDFSPFATVADIGGGRGHLLQAILDRVPAASGVLFDLPHVITDASGAATERLRLSAGDFFRDRLPEADVYVLMEVIHDWTDADATKILSAVRRAAPKHARVLVVEALVSESPGPQFAKMLDIIMLAVTGGHERTRAEYERLLASTGFRLERIIPTASQYSLVEGVVA